MLKILIEILKTKSNMLKIWIENAKNLNLKCIKIKCKILKI